MLMRLTSPDTLVRRRLLREEGRERVGVGVGEDGEEDEGEMLVASAGGAAGSGRSGFEGSNPPGDFLGDLGAVASGAPDTGHIDITAPPPPPPA